MFTVGLGAGYRAHVHEVFVDNGSVSPFTPPRSLLFLYALTCNVCGFRGSRIQLHPVCTSMGLACVLFLSHPSLSSADMPSCSPEQRRAAHGG